VEGCGRRLLEAATRRAFPGSNRPARHRASLQPPTAAPRRAAAGTVPARRPRAALRGFREACVQATHPQASAPAEFLGDACPWLRPSVVMFCFIWYEYQLNFVLFLGLSAQFSILYIFQLD